MASRNKWLVLHSRIHKIETKYDECKQTNITYLLYIRTIDHGGVYLLKNLSFVKMNEGKRENLC